MIDSKNEAVSIYHDKKWYKVIRVAEYLFECEDVESGNISEIQILNYDSESGNEHLVGSFNEQITFKWLKILFDSMEETLNSMH